MLTHHHEIALDAIELRHSREKSPPLKAQTLKQTQTRLVMPEDQTDQGCDAQRGRAGDRLFQQSLSHAVPPKLFTDINTDLGSAAIRTAWQQFFEIEPANHATVRFCDPEWIFVRRMFAKPWQTRFDGGRLKLGRHHAGRDSGVVNFDDGRQVRLNSIANDQIHGFRFFVGLRLTAGELVGVSVELVSAVATGLAMGNANVGDTEAGGVADAVDEGDGVALGDDEGLGVGLGVGEGGMIFSQGCSGTLAPPISLTSVSQRA